MDTDSLTSSASNMTDMTEELEEADQISQLPTVVVRPTYMAPNFSKIRRSGKQRRISAPALVNSDTEPLIWDRSFIRRQSVTNPADMAEVESIMPNREVTAETLGLKPYKRRFYVLFVVQLVMFCAGALYITIPPVAHSAEQIYSFTDGEIALLSNWTSIGFVAGFFLMIWIVDTRGLKFATILTTFFLFVGAGVRCFVIFDRHLARWLFHLGGLFIGFSTTYINIAPATLSSIWFPTEERTTATAITSMGTLVGAAVSSVVGPYVITEDIDVKNDTNSSGYMYPDFIHHRHKNETEHIRNIQFHEFLQYLFIQTGVIGVCFVLVLIYFPAKPPTPPSLSASIQRMAFKDGLFILLRMKDFLLLSMAYAFPYGVYMAWLALLDINLKDLGISQREVGWLLAANLLSGVVLALIMGRVADCTRRKFKLLMICDVFIGILAMTWFCLQRYRYIPSTEVTVYAATILIGITCNSMAPIAYEAVVEMTHPVSEGISLGTNAIFLNIASLIFLLLPLVPGVGSHWINWCLLGSNVIALPLYLLYKQRYNRQILDSLSSENPSHHFENSDALNY